MKFSKSVLNLEIACAALTLLLAMSAQAQSTTFYDLTGTFGGTGWEPYSTVTQATDGNFYGTATGGIGFFGNIFRLTPSGEMTNVHTFICTLNNCANGAAPTTAPIIYPDGDLYGVTGTTFYKLTLSGNLKTLYSFGKSGDWTVPTGIILGNDGNFYGTTQYGGTTTNGSIFKITPSGEYTDLYSFCPQTICSDGSSPLYPPVLGDDGNLYGTTLSGGANHNGVIYQLTPTGHYTVLYSFCDFSSPCPDGWNVGPLVMDADGNFIGTTIEGGANEYGVVFRITPSGQYSVLYNFTKTAGMIGWANSQLILASDGNFYGDIGRGRIRILGRQDPRRYLSSFVQRRLHSPRCLL